MTTESPADEVDAFDEIKEDIEETVRFCCCCKRRPRKTQAKRKETEDKENHE